MTTEQSIFITQWQATATGNYRRHPLYGQLVRQGLVASGGFIKQPAMTLSMAAGQ
jgi:hypothetical protein